MKRLLLALLLTASAFLIRCDFEGAWKECHDAGGRCIESVNADAGGTGGGEGGGSGTDAGADAGTNGGLDAGADGGLDAGADGGLDAGTDGGLDAGTGLAWRLAYSLTGPVRGVWRVAAVSPNEAYFSAKDAKTLIQFYDGGFTPVFDPSFEPHGICTTLGRLVVAGADPLVFTGQVFTLPANQPINWNAKTTILTSSSGKFTAAWCNSTNAAVGQITGDAFISNGGVTVMNPAGWPSVNAPILDGTFDQQAGQTPMYLVTADDPAPGFWRASNTGRTQESPDPHFSVSARHGNFVWVGGLIQSVLRYDVSSAPASMVLPTGLADVRGIWSTAEDNVWFAGGAHNTVSGGHVMRYDGANFIVTRVSDAALLDVGGTGPEDIWATDLDGGIWRYSRK